MGHVINMEFDGANASIKLDSIVPGMYIKLCLGRGLTNAASWASQASSMVNPLYPNSGSTPNYIPVEGSLDNTDMLGIILKAYDDGQYSVMTKWYRGYSVPGLKMTGTNTAQMKSFGNMDGMAISAKMDGIGDEINDFLDDTIIFASLAISQTQPEKSQAMLGSTSV